MPGLSSQIGSVENKTEAILIRTVIAMTTLTKPMTTPFRWPRWHLPRFAGAERRRKQAMIDLVHASPYLLRDIGVTEGMIANRKP